MARSLSRSWRRVLWLIPVAAVAGCVERTMTLTSDPPGALVYLNGQEVGSTPLTRDFTWYGKYDVQIRKEGYQTLKTTTKVDPPVWQWIPIDLAVDLLPVRCKDERQYSYSLLPASTEAANAQQTIARAHDLEGQLQSSQYTRPATRPAATQPAREH